MELLFSYGLRHASDVTIHRKYFLCRLLLDREHRRIEKTIAAVFDICYV